jgi:hypothetical protein
VSGSALGRGVACSATTAPHAVWGGVAYSATPTSPAMVDPPLVGRVLVGVTWVTPVLEPTREGEQTPPRWAPVAAGEATTEVQGSGVACSATGSLAHVGEGANAGLARSDAVRGDVVDLPPRPRPPDPADDGGMLITSGVRAGYRRRTSRVRTRYEQGTSWVRGYERGTSDVRGYERGTSRVRAGNEGTSGVRAGYEGTKGVRAGYERGTSDVRGYDRGTSRVRAGYEGTSGVRAEYEGVRAGYEGREQDTRQELGILVFYRTEDKMIVITWEYSYLP